MPLQNEQQIVATRQTVRSLCQMLKFSLVDQTKMITAASELSRNTLIHGKGGHMNWAIIEVNGKQALQLIFEDTGPGIKDLKMAMTDGFTDRKSTRLNSSHSQISYAVFCLKKKKKKICINKNTYT